MRYAYKASLVGSAHQFELTEDGLAWRIAGRSGVWDYADISAVKLSYRPVSMQQQRFRADIDNAKGGRIAVLSTTWQTATLVAPQGDLYRAFIVELHRRMQAAGRPPGWSEVSGRRPTPPRWRCWHALRWQ